VELTSAPVGSLGSREGAEPMELVMAQAATALIKFRMGQHTEAHQRLSLVLRAAHGRLVGSMGPCLHGAYKWRMPIP